MHPAHRLLALTAIVASVLVSACGKSEPPPPPPAPAPPPQPAAPQLNAELQRLAGEVYVFALPAVITDLTREADTAGAGWNAFLHQRALPDASTKDVQNPNADFLYSRAWLDLSKEPIVLSAPDTKGRYYLVAMLDAWTNVAASLGTRTGGNEKAEYAIVGPRWKGKLPGGVLEVQSPTELAWLFARVEVKGPADRGAALRVQEQLTLAPLSERGKRPAKGKAREPAHAAPPSGEKRDPREQIAKMDAAAFFTRFAMLLPGNPPNKDDAPMREKIAKLGIEPGKPFDVAKLDPIAAKSIEEGVRTTRAAIVQAAARGTGGDIVNGWFVDRALGRWGVDYGKRAVAAWNGIGVNAPEDAIFMSTRLDGEGRPLDGSHRYVLHFAKGGTPPADGFWSVSLYDAEHHFVANPINRHNIGSDEALKTNADGSLDLFIQNQNPGGEKSANWLPAPKGPFNVILRIYWPKQDVLDGRWNAPGIQRTG